MKMHSEGKKEELEYEKKRLVDVKRMTVETVEKIRKLESDMAEGKIQHQKKVSNLQSIQASQDLRLVKLDNDIKNFETVLASRREDFESLEKTKTENVEELQKIKTETANSASTFIKYQEELEREIKKGYLQLEKDRETQVVLEVGLSYLKEEEQIPFIEALVKKRRETSRNHQKEINEEMSRIEQQQTAIEAEIKQKQKELVGLKEDYLALIGVYTKKKKLKK